MQLMKARTPKEHGPHKTIQNGFIRWRSALPSLLSASVNPTLTVIAHTLRVADRIVERLV